MQAEVLRRLIEYSQKFKGTSLQSELSKATNAYILENYDEVNSILDTFPTEPELLEKLLDRIKGKSVERGLKKTLRGDATILEQAKSLSSLYTHCLIECEQNTEFKAVARSTFKKLLDLQDKI